MLREAQTAAAFRAQKQTKVATKVGAQRALGQASGSKGPSEAAERWKQTSSKSSNSCGMRIDAFD